ncbi:MAG: hypothetical protein V1816_02195 [Pseudomonadota bacterium]
MTFLGSWIIAGLKLTLVQDFLELSSRPSLNFILELSAMTMALFGLLTILAVLPELRSRIARIESLGEKNW